MPLITDPGEIQKHLPKILSHVQGHYVEHPKCLICEDPISHEWLDGNYEVLLCPKKSCWEKFLPRDLAKKFFDHKTRYQHMKTETKKEPSKPETKMSGGRYKIARETCTDSTTNSTRQ